MKKKSVILAIETSCDETAAAVLSLRNNKVKILADIVSSQVKIHAKFGGIVPEVAARLQLEQILPIINEALKQAKIKPQNLSAIAFTGGPGLITSLLVGAETAKTLAYAWQKPLINVNHIESHIYSSLLNEEIKFPALCLVVSGGHTELIYMSDHGEYERIGGTRDDAVGEAFDKVAKMMDLGYPGGPVIAAQATKYQASSTKLQTNSKFKISNIKNQKADDLLLMTNYTLKFPRPMLNTGDFEMSFSGLKTAVLHALSKIKKITPKIKVAMCHEFQAAVTDVLIYKTIDAAQKLKVKSLILGGGVSANHALRQKLSIMVKNQIPKVKIYLPELKYTGDNAVMVGLAAFQHLQKKDFISPFGFRADPNWELV